MLTVRAQFPDLDLVDMLPALDAVLFRKFRSRPPQYSRHFHVRSSSRSMEQSTQVTGVGLLRRVPEGTNVQYDKPVPGSNKTWIHEQYGLGVSFSKMMKMNAQYPVIRKTMEDMGLSARETVEVLAASDYNNAFDPAYPGPDGVPLVSLDHPLWKKGGVQANTLPAPADLDVMSLRAAMVLGRKMVDHTGKKMMVPFTRMVVPPDLEATAIELTKTNERPDTANNAINATRHFRENAMRNYEVYDYIIDPDTWFITVAPSELPLKFWWREKPNTIHDVHFDSRNIQSAIWMQQSHGWDDYMGIIGVPGA